ncbi:hypothetical protein CRYUN_Cryun17cG0103200 [Craigia yunnanensis]
MPNGSLDSHLFGRRSPLAWRVRYRISLGLASALLYLHEEWGSYLAPEYISTGRASKESDVFSFGVVILEIATGRKSVDPGGKSDMGLVEWTWGVYGKEELLLAVDEK